MIVDRNDGTVISRVEPRVYFCSNAMVFVTFGYDIYFCYEGFSVFNFLILYVNIKELLLLS